METRFPFPLSVFSSAARRPFYRIGSDRIVDSYYTCPLLTLPLPFQRWWRRRHGRGTSVRNYANIPCWLGDSIHQEDWWIMEFRLRTTNNARDLPLCHITVLPIHPFTTPPRPDAPLPSTQWPKIRKRSNKWNIEFLTVTQQFYCSDPVKFKFFENTPTHPHKLIWHDTLSQ